MLTITLATQLSVQMSAGILLGAADLAEVSPERWRERTSALYQDLARVELSLQHSIGIGRLADVDSPGPLSASLARTGSPLGDEIALEDVLGLGYADGRELSGGQWQNVGFARSLMRDDPLLLVLDEPAAALDALASSVSSTRTSRPRPKSPRGSAA